LFTDNWIDAYKKHFGTDRRIARQADLLKDDDDEIQFESMPNVATGDAASVFQRPPLLLSAAVGTKEAFFTARVPGVAW
jgi:hypothetical protein